MGEDKPLVSRRVAAFLSVILIIAILATLYFLFSGMRGGVANPYESPKQPPEEQKWELSPLVSQYGITSTPVLVVNCRYTLTGSYALSEKKGAVPEGTEEENIGGALCTATGDSVLCSRFGRTAKNLIETNFPSCKGNRILVYAFHSPSCQISSAQRDVLNALRDEFQSQFDVEYVCVPTGSGGMDACSREFLAGKYNK